MFKATRVRSLIVLAIAAVLCFSIFYIVPWPTVHVDVSTELVGPDQEAMATLLQGGTLPEIRGAVAKSGVSVDEITYMNGTLLYHAVAEGRYEVVEWLLMEGACPDGIVPIFGGVPLEKAVRNGDVRMVMLLVRYGANPDLDMLRGRTTPRKEAEHIGNSQVIEALKALETPNR